MSLKLLLRLPLLLYGLTLKLLLLTLKLLLPTLELLLWLALLGSNVSRLLIGRKTWNKLWMSGLTRHGSMHWNSISVKAWHWRSKVLARLKNRLRITLWISSWMTITYRWHSWNIWIWIALRHLAHLHHFLNFFLSLLF